MIGQWVEEVVVVVEVAAASVMPAYTLVRDGVHGDETACETLGTLGQLAGRVEVCFLLDSGGGSAPIQQASADEHGNKKGMGLIWKK